MYMLCWYNVSEPPPPTLSHDQIWTIRNIMDFVLNEAIHPIQLVATNTAGYYVMVKQLWPKAYALG